MEKEYHVHVYRVKGLIEVNVEAKSRNEALSKALKEVENAPPQTFMKSDCEMVAIGGLDEVSATMDIADSENEEVGEV